MLCILSPGGSSASLDLATKHVGVGGETGLSGVSKNMLRGRRYLTYQVSSLNRD